MAEYMNSSVLIRSFKQLNPTGSFFYGVGLLSKMRDEDAGEVVRVVSNLYLIRQA